MGLSKALIGALSGGVSSGLGGAVGGAASGIVGGGAIQGQGIDNMQKAPGWSNLLFHILQGLGSGRGVASGVGDYGLERARYRRPRVDVPPDENPHF